MTDAVQEFAVQTSVALPEFGRGTGAQLNVVAKSGGNQFNGSAFEYFRNSRMDIADFFINKQGGQKTALYRNQFGGTLGSPIVKGRTFFFLSYGGFPQMSSQVSSTRVPTVAERTTVTLKAPAGSRLYSTISIRRIPKCIAAPWNRIPKGAARFAKIAGNRRVEAYEDPSRFANY